MGLFILGILAGWLAEWVFFTFFVKDQQSTNNQTNTNALQAELDARNREIKALKQKLEKAEKAAPAPAATKPLADKPKPALAETKTETGQTATAAVATKPAVSKAKTASVATDTKQTAQKKAAAKKTTPKKAVVKAKTKSGNDDFTLLSGIGPSMAKTLNEIGITTFKKLADMDDDILRDMLEASGARLNNNKEAMDSWNEQAQLADKGDFKGLKQLQESLKRKK